MGLRLLFFCLFLLVIEIYAYQAVKTLIKLRWMLLAYSVISLLLLVFIVYSFTQFDRSVGQTKQTMFTMGLLLVVYLPKIVMTVILLGEDVFRLAAGSINYFIDNNSNANFLPSRRKFVSQIGIGLAAIPFLSLIYGIFEGRYNYKVIKQAISFSGFTRRF